MTKKILEVRDGWPYGKEKSIPRKPLPWDAPRSQSEEMLALQEQVRHLQFEVDVLKETLAALKKDPGVDLTALKNREKPVTAP